ncbi:hypothetical protein DFH08DRAFT_980614 [Mycena albidolilacea]|uniref:Uncharacterized protein n=1 Tax=Mycena albidolilacea TaxID=1033008 RepID=A0AAD7ATT9_9AGAR|nr:hypothetical protein DFH08DRAFT_980614 [Mycena albidolilacea]
MSHRFSQASVGFILPSAAENAGDGFNTSRSQDLKLKPRLNPPQDASGLASSLRFKTSALSLSVVAVFPPDFHHSPGDSSLRRAPSSPSLSWPPPFPRQLSSHFPLLAVYHFSPLHRPLPALRDLSGTLPKLQDFKIRQDPQALKSSKPPSSFVKPRFKMGLLKTPQELALARYLASSTLSLGVVTFLASPLHCSSFKPSRNTKTPSLQVLKPSSPQDEPQDAPQDPRRSASILKTPQDFIKTSSHSKTSSFKRRFKLSNRASRPRVQGVKTSNPQVPKTRFKTSSPHALKSPKESSRYPRLKMLFKTSGLKRATLQTPKTRRTPQALKLKILENLEPHFRPPQVLKTPWYQVPAAPRFQALKTRDVPSLQSSSRYQDLKSEPSKPQAALQDASLCRVRESKSSKPQAAAQFFVRETLIRQFTVTRMYIIRGGCFAALVFMPLNFERCTQPPQYALIPYGSRMASEKTGNM